MSPEKENQLIEKQLKLVRYRASFNPSGEDRQSNMPDRRYRLNAQENQPTVESTEPENYPLGDLLEML